MRKVFIVVMLLFVLVNTLYAGSAAAGIGPSAIIIAKDPWVDVRAYGATGDGETDDLAAIQTAIDSLSSNGGVIFFPPGSYECSDQLTHTNKSIVIIGAGVGISEIRFTGAAGGFDIDFDNIDDNLTIMNLTLTTEAAAGGTAIDALWPSTASSTYCNCYLTNLEIRGSVLANDYWTRGIVLSDAWNGIISDLMYQGKFNDVSSTYGIYLIGNSIDVYISKCHIYFCGTGIYVSGTTEGTNINQCTIVFTTDGITFYTAGLEPGTAITNSHVNVFRYGIQLLNRWDTVVSGNLIYKEAASTSNFVGIRLGGGFGARRNRIVNNHISGAGASGADNGIAILDGDDNIITGNYIKDQDTSVWLQADAHNNLAMGNLSRDATSDVVDSGVNNIITKEYTSIVCYEGDIVTYENELVTY